MQCLSVSLFWILGKHKILGDKPRMQKMQACVSAGQGTQWVWGTHIPCCVWLTQSPGNSPSPKIWPGLGKQGGLSLQAPKQCLWKGLKNMFSAHHTINHQLCAPFWLKVQGNEAFSTALLAFHRFHSSMPWNCSGERFVVVDWALCFWREFGIFFKKAHPREGEAVGWENFTASLSLCALLMPSADSFFLFFACWLWGPGDRTSLLQGSICSSVVLSAPSPSVWKSLCPVACASCLSSWFSPMYSQV